MTWGWSQNPGFTKWVSNPGGGFKYFYVHPYLGKIPILTHIFQMGWNHQPVIYYLFVFYDPGSRFGIPSRVKQPTGQWFFSSRGRPPGPRAPIYDCHGDVMLLMATRNPKANHLAYMGASLNGGSPKSSIWIGFSIINHPYWGTTILGNPHIKPCKSWDFNLPTVTTGFVFSPDFWLPPTRVMTFRYFWLSWMPSFFHDAFGLPLGTYFFSSDFECKGENNRLLGESVWGKNYGDLFESNV